MRSSYHANRAGLVKGRRGCKMRSFSVVWVALAALVACNGGSKDGVDTNDTASFDPFDFYVNVPSDVSATGAFTCFTPGDDHASTTWLTQSVDSELVGISTFTGKVEDFESDAAVEDATVELWYDDAVVGQSDVSAMSDQNGILSIDAPVCQVHTYLVSTNPVLDLYRPTYKAHSVYGPDLTGNVTFTVVSKTTYQLIPTIAGTPVEPGKAIIAGTAFDCMRAPDANPDDDAGKIQGVQVVVYDEDGNIPDTLKVNYFTEKFPDRNQKWTSADGLWVAINVPPGRLRAELWGRVDGELTLLGATLVDSAADTINIANIFAGYGDGVKFPASCLAAE